jgi:multicomponent Na+:H+ antiporter subunit A
VIRPSSLILDTLAGTIVRLALVFSLYLLFAGHNAPGGGFVGGLVAGVALIIGFLSRGTGVLRRFGRFGPEVVMGVGLGTAALTGIGGWIWGDEFLASKKVVFTLPVWGEVGFTTALPFDIGVYLVVVGLAAAVIASLGREAEVDLS